jgi:hypothetical protein
MGLLRNRAGAARGGCVAPIERLAYAICFFGVCLTGLGSGYYHWQPNDLTLVWDRMPLTLVFMSLLAAGIAERISYRAAQWLLGPLAIAGIGSVAYWNQTGNLWPYAAAQYFSLVLMLLLLLLFPARYTRAGDFVLVLVVYGVAKAAEALDEPILAITGVLSGHTLKHLIAASAVWLIWRMLRLRR